MIKTDQEVHVLSSELYKTATVTSKTVQEVQLVEPPGNRGLL